MSRFTTDMQIGVYGATIELSYTETPLRRNRDSGEWEGGVSLQWYKVVSAFWGRRKLGPKIVARLQAEANGY